MKICIILPNSTPSNPEYYNNQEIGLAKSLLKYNVETDIFIYSSTAKKIECTKLIKNHQAEIRIFEYPGIRLPGQQALSLKLLKFLKDSHHAYSIFQVYETSQILSVLIAILATFFKKPCVLCIGMYEDFKELYKRILQNIYDIIFTSFLLKKVDLIICKTEMALNYIKSKGLRPSVPAKVIHIGLDIEKFNDNINNNLEFEIPQNIDILYVGKIEKRRNPIFMMNLFKKYLEYHNNTTIVIIGDGPELKNCINIAYEFHIEKNVIFTGKIKNCHLPPFYKRSKLLILPSNYEIYGMVILEAMYFGVPVVASNCAGPREIITHDQDGIIINELSLESWYFAIEKLLTIDSYHKQLSLNAQKKILTEFGWDKLSEQYFLEYNKLNSSQC